MTMASIANTTISITGMTGDACVEKVKTALKACPGVTIQSVTVGSATISADAAACTAACAAIKNAGFQPKPTHASNVTDAGKPAPAQGACTPAQPATAVAPAKPLVAAH
jgi:copper chaperone CopZ